MSESSKSKAAQKNKKRAEKRAEQRAQKLKEDGIIGRLIQESEDPVAKLKTQLQEAKNNKDHKLAAKLRKDLWVLQDQLTGHLPPGETLEPSLETPDEVLDQKEAVAITTKVSDDLPTQTEKKLRNLKKKLQQIQRLKEKQDGGEELEESQIAKIQTEEVVLQEIQELEELMKQALTI